MRRPSRQLKLNQAAEAVGLGEQGQKGTRLRGRGDGLAGQEVRARGRQQVESFAVELAQRGLVPVIGARVLGPVGKGGAVGSDARGHEGAPSSRPVRGIGPEGIADVRGQPHAREQEIGRGASREALPPEALEGRLVAGAHDAIRACLQIGSVDGRDGLGRVLEQAGRPQRMVQVEAAGFELGGEAAVEDQRASVREKRTEHLRPGSSVHGRAA